MTAEGAGHRAHLPFVGGLTTDEIAKAFPFRCRPSRPASPARRRRSPPRACRYRCGAAERAEQARLGAQRDLPDLHRRVVGDERRGVDPHGPRTRSPAAGRVLTRLVPEPEVVRVARMLESRRTIPARSTPKDVPCCIEHQTGGAGTGPRSSAGEPRAGEGERLWPWGWVRRAAGGHRGVPCDQPSVAADDVEQDRAALRSPRQITPSTVVELNRAVAVAMASRGRRRASHSWTRSPSECIVDRTAPAVRAELSHDWDEWMTRAPSTSELPPCAATRPSAPCRGEGSGPGLSCPNGRPGTPPTKRMAIDRARPEPTVGGCPPTAPVCSGGCGRRRVLVTVISPRGRRRLDPLFIGAGRAWSPPCSRVPRAALTRQRLPRGRQWMGW